MAAGTLAGKLADRFISLLEKCKMIILGTYVLHKINFSYLMKSCIFYLFATSMHTYKAKLSAKVPRLQCLKGKVTSAAWLWA